MKAKRTLTIINANDFDAGIQEIIDKAAGVITDHPNGIHATDYDFAVMVAEKLALWLNAAREMGVIGGCKGYSNFATMKAAHILANWETHHKEAAIIVKIIIDADEEKERVIVRIMSGLRGYFTEIADWHTAQTYEMPGSSGKECADFKGAVSEMCNVGIGQINWRELAEELIDDSMEFFKVKR